MYTVVVIDGRANGLPIPDSLVFLTDCSGQYQSLQAKSRMARFVSIVPGFSPLPEQTADCLGKSSLRASGGLPDLDHSKAAVLNSLPPASDT